LVATPINGTGPFPIVPFGRPWLPTVTYRYFGRDAVWPMGAADDRWTVATEYRGDPAGRRANSDAADRIVCRCHGCGVRFLADPGGPGCCPRCGAIGGHERLGRPSAREE